MNRREPRRPLVLASLRAGAVRIRRPESQTAVAYVAVVALFVGRLRAGVSSQRIRAATGDTGADLPGPADPRPAPARRFANMDLVGSRLRDRGCDRLRRLSRWRRAVHAADQSDRGELRQPRPARSCTTSSDSSIAKAIAASGDWRRRPATSTICWLERAAQDRSPGDVPIYVLYTPDMLLKYRAMRTLGSSPQPSGRDANRPGFAG